MKKPMLIFVLMNVSTGIVGMGTARKIQEVLRHCGEEKKLDECRELVAEARVHNRLAIQTCAGHTLPICAPWRDSYKTAEREQHQAGAASAGAASVQKPACPFCDQFSRPHDDQLNYVN